MSTPPPGPSRRPAGRSDPSRPELERLLAVVARATLEVLAGRRPLRQLLGLLSPALYDRLLARLPRTGVRPRAPTAAVVRRVLTTWPTPGTCEATVLIDRGGRTTALAVRAERYRRRWRIVEIAAPEDGLDPLRTPPRLEPWPVEQPVEQTAERTEDVTAPRGTS